MILFQSVFVECTLNIAHQQSVARGRKTSNIILLLMFELLTALAKQWHRQTIENEQVAEPHRPIRSLHSVFESLMRGFLPFFLCTAKKVQIRHGFLRIKSEQQR